MSGTWWLDCPCLPGITTRTFPQQENGVGSIRAFLEALDAATQELPSAVAKPRRCSWVVGQIVAQALQPVAERLNAVDGVEFHLIGLPSPYWGQGASGDRIADGTRSADWLGGPRAGR